MWRRTTIPMQMRLMMSTVLGAILNPVLSSEKYFSPADTFFVDISIIIINTCNTNQLNSNIPSQHSISLYLLYTNNRSPFIVLYFQIHKDIQILMNTINCLFNLLLIFLLSVDTSQCHYSCLECTSSSFDNCRVCSRNQSLTYIMDEKDGNEIGICAELRQKSPNILGIAMLSVTISSCILFKGEKLFYFAFMFQTIGLLYLFNTYWILLIDYVLQACSYFMLSSYIMYLFKQNNSTFQSGSGYKAKIFLKNAKLTENLILLGPLNILIVILLILIPLYKYCRKYSPHRQIADWKLQKAVEVLNVVYFFLIQETMTIIFIGFSQSSQVSSSDIIITAFYLISVLLYIFNQFKYPLPLFRNRYSQFFIFLSRVIGPLFLSFSNKIPWVFYLCIFPLILFEAISTNQNKDKGQINRLFFYKFGFLITFGATAINYVVDNTTGSENVAYAFGCIGFAGIVLFLFLFVIEILLDFKKEICVQGNQGERSITEENIQVCENNKDIKIYPLDHEPQKLPSIRPKKKKHAPHQTNESIGHLDMNAISLDFSSMAGEPNIVFNFPEQPIQPVLTKMPLREQRLQVTLNQSQQQQYFIPQLQKYSLQENPAYSNFSAPKKIQKQCMEQKQVKDI